MPILKKSGRVVIAESIAAQPMHVAWGTGDGVWTVPVTENPEATALLNEVGRHTSTVVGYVVSDAAGAIILPAGRYSLSVTPTNSLYVAVNFELTDAPSAVIREVAVFVGTVVSPGLPGGQIYFLPGQITDPGRLLHSENIAPIYRSLSARESFAFVLTF